VILKRFFRRSAWDAERARELDAYLTAETDDNIARGMSPGQARAAAHRKLGNVTLVREEIYLMNTVALIDSAWRDLKHGARLLRLNPAFALVAVLSLALGIGANTAIFQLLDAVRIRTLPVDEPWRLVDVRIETGGHGRTGRFTGRAPQLTYPLLEQIRARQDAFSGLAAWGTASFNMTTRGEARYARGMWVNGEYFQTLGVKPLLGRLLTPADDVRGCAAPGVVLSYGFWQREFGGGISAIGRSLQLEGHNYDVIGVTPAQFFGLEVGRSFDVALPLCAEPLTRAEGSALDKPDVWFLGLFARLKPGSTLEGARAQLASISPALFQATLPPHYRPEDSKNYLAFRLIAQPAGTGVSALRRDYESPLWLLLATTALVLVIACANLANLMLARASAREREIAVRLAIGASRGRIVRQLLAESLLLSAIGAAGGLFIARWLSAFLVGFLSSQSNRGGQVFVDLATDWRVFAFTGGLAVATCLIFGLTPAIRATATDPGAAMKAGSRGSTDSRERFGLRRSLVVAQVALSLVLVVGAMLFVRSLRNLMLLDAGFRQDGILVVNLDLRGSGTPVEARHAQNSDLLARVRGVPGVDDAAAASIVPVSGSGWNNTIVVDGKEYGDDRKYVVNFNAVSPGYFRTMGTPILAGRDFSAADAANSAKVAIVTERFAARFFGGQNPIGRAFQIQEGAGLERPLYQIIGLAKDAKYQDLREEFTPIAFLAAAQEKEPDPFLQIVVRSSAPLAAVTGGISALVAERAPTAILEFQTLNTMVRDSLLRERLMATLSGFFGLLAGVLATIGLYGVMAYMVERRRNEIGIRVALGADRTAVVRMIMREALTLVAAGLLVGGLAAFGASHWAKTLLFGLKPGDPASMVMAAAALTIVAALASYVPAWRASRLEPTEALREE
jgi:putative ABC transport system permease protein